MTEAFNISPEAQALIDELLDLARETQDQVISIIQDDPFSEEDIENFVEKISLSVDIQDASGDPMQTILDASKKLMDAALRPHRRRLAEAQYTALPRVQTLSLDEYVVYIKGAEDLTIDFSMKINTIMETLFSTQVIPRLMKMEMDKRTGKAVGSPIDPE